MVQYESLLGVSGVRWADKGCRVMGAFIMIGSSGTRKCDVSVGFLVILPGLLVGFAPKEQSEFRVAGKSGCSNLWYRAEVVRF